MNEDQRHISESLRQEILERIRLRTQINWFKMATLGALLAVKNDSIPWFLPFVAFSFDFSILHNSIYIHTIGNFLYTYKEWEQYEGRFHEGESWWKIPVDLLLDRLGYVSITFFVSAYSWVQLGGFDLFSCYVGIVWCCVLLVFGYVELRMLPPTLIRSAHKSKR